MIHELLETNVYAIVSYATMAIIFHPQLGLPVTYKYVIFVQYNSLIFISMPFWQKLPSDRVKGRLLYTIDHE